MRHRHLQVLPKPQANPARHPVVAVQAIVLQTFPGDKGLHVGQKLRQVVNHVMLGIRRRRTGIEMNDARALIKFEHLRQIRILAARIHIDGNAVLAQLTAQLAHIDIHPARHLPP